MRRYCSSSKTSTSTASLLSHYVSPSFLYALTACSLYSDTMEGPQQQQEHDHKNAPISSAWVADALNDAVSESPATHEVLNRLSQDDLYYVFVLKICRKALRVSRLPDDERRRTVDALQHELRCINDIKASSSPEFAVAKMRQLNAYLATERD